MTISDMPEREDSIRALDLAGGEDIPEVPELVDLKTFSARSVVRERGQGEAEAPADFPAEGKPLISPIFLGSKISPTQDFRKDPHSKLTRRSPKKRLLSMSRKQNRFIFLTSFLAPKSMLRRCMGNIFL